jgi:hypothetical protein
MLDVAKGFASNKPLIIHRVLNWSTYQDQSQRSQFNFISEPRRDLASAGASDLGPGEESLRPTRDGGSSDTRADVGTSYDSRDTVQGER